MGHLDDINMTYVDHARRSLGLALAFAYAATTALIHALFPDLFTTSSTNAIITTLPTLLAQGVPSTRTAP